MRFLLNKYICFCLLLFSSLCLGASAKDNSSGFEQMLSKIELSVRQKQQIERIKNTQKAMTASLEVQLKEKQDELESLLNDDSSTDQAITLLKRKIDLLDGQINEVKAHSRRQIKRLLTSRQREQLREMQFAAM